MNTSRLVLMGDSAGATLAVVSAYELNRQQSMVLAGLCLIYPVADLHSPHETYSSRLQFGDGDYLIGRDGIDLARALYLEPDQDTRDPRVSPIFSTDEMPFIRLPQETVKPDPIYD